MVTHGKEWFVSNTKQYGFVKVYPPASFSGPDQICDEEIYTITNPGAISLEDATGIATLTDLGNNQWKISRIGTSSKIITLKSSQPNGQTNTKAITVGVAAQITGLPSGNLQPNTVYSASVTGSSGLSSFSWTVTGGTIVDQTSTTVHFRTDPNPNTIPNNISIGATFDSPCGLGSAGTTKYVNPGGGSPIDPGETL